MRVFFDIYNLWDAKNKLEKLGIKWDSVKRYVEMKKTWNGNTREWISPLAYFMVGNCDIAYYVDGMGLAIHDKPRSWGEKDMSCFKNF